MRTVKQVPLPVQYVTTRVVQCDGCGEVAGTETSAMKIGWLVIDETVERTAGGEGFKTLFDFCPKCRPRVEKTLRAVTDQMQAEVIKAAADTLNAEALEAKAEAVGVT